jgi:hypothetical protein
MRFIESIAPGGRELEAVDAAALAGGACAGAGCGGDLARDVGASAQHVVDAAVFHAPAFGVQLLQAGLDAQQHRRLVGGVEVEPEAYELVSEFTTISEPNAQAGGALRVAIKVGHLPNLGHLIAKYGGAARVIAPETARQIVLKYALIALGEKSATPDRIENED